MNELSAIEFIEHTGDIGVRVRAPELKELFVRAAQATFQIICPQCKVEPAVERAISVAGGDLEELLVNWLSELNYWFCTEQELYGHFCISSLDKSSLHATVRGEKVDLQRHKLRTEIKAVTYHKLYVRQAEHGWEAQVIFDI
ncbi:MAG: archease [candidate division KSB1 bacterium]|nr:archease [candidate division KSB1 bacterium]MDZ7337652.1 archease [candidate division KSB1 bacterium]MDZ7393612.1 archease [candidate division KSB1 bacterium]